MTNENELIEAYLDDSLTDEQSAQFHTWLIASDENLRKFALASARNEQLRQSVVSEQAVAERRPSPDRRTAWSTLGRAHRSIAVRGLAVASLVVIGFLLVSSPAQSATQVSLVGSNTPVSLRTDNRAERWLNAGDSFRVGTLVAENDATRARFAYHDGSVFSLHGESELTLANDAAKRMVLHKGLLRADVIPQPDRQPMKVRTPSAEATVLGTSFALNAAETETLLQVHKGEVTLRRLVDDREATARENEQLLAFQSEDAPLQAEPIPEVPSSWSASPTKEPGQSILGNWTDERVLMAVPRKILLKNSGVEESHFHAGVRSDLPGVVRLERDSLIRVRYRVNRPINVGLFLSTRSSSWDFTGNFQAYLVDEENPADADGWKTGTISVASLLPMGAKIPFNPGCIASTLLATTYSQDVGLEIAEFEVVRQ